MIVLITGANGDIGRAIAEAFRSESPSNHIWLGRHKKREQVQALILSHPDTIHEVELDVTQPDSWKRCCELILQRHGRIDALINNAGLHHDALLGNMQLAAWETVLRTNLDGAFHGCQAVLPAMISQRSGRIINISSLSALLAPAGQTNYAAAKAGLIGLTGSLAKEVARMGITVNAICPGYIDTDALSSMDPAARQAAQAKIPMRRFGKPLEVAAAVRFLACPEAAYITGSVLKIDGGIL